MSKLSNPEILFRISQKQTRKIIGLMSGTSLDGLDVAFCTFSGSGVNCSVKLEQFKTVSYDQETKKEIKSVFCKESVEFEKLCILNAWLGNFHSGIILSCLQDWRISPKEVDIIASHGQTVFHAPRSFHKKLDLPNSTLQIGDGDHIAVKTGIITISDFRQKHVAAGGEGAPLALYGDYFIFSKKGENRIMLNIGGISNITCLFGDLDATKAFATDLGPGNTLLDAFTRQHFKQDFDEDGTIAGSGNVNIQLLEKLKAHSFFDASFPKTTGPELFNLKYVTNAQVDSGTLTLSPADVLATLTKFSAEVIADGIKRIGKDLPFRIYGSGGGVHNPILMGYLQTLLPDMNIKLTDELGISGDAKEAVLFATLANEAITGGSTNFGVRNAVPSVTMGKISFPN